MRPLLQYDIFKWRVIAGSRGFAIECLVWVRLIETKRVTSCGTSQRYHLPYLDGIHVSMRKWLSGFVFEIKEVQWRPVWLYFNGRLWL